MDPRAGEKRQKIECAGGGSTVVTSTAEHPVLLPLFDCTNHKRNTQVSGAPAMQFPVVSRLSIANEYCRGVGHVGVH